MTYWAIYEKTDTGYSAYLPDLPGCITTGPTLEETQRNMIEAVTGHLEVMQEFGEIIPVPTTVAACVQVEVPAEALTHAA